MKINFLFCLFLILTFSSLVAAQSIVITPKKVVYTRKGEDISQYKRNFTITYPIISGRISFAAKKNIKKELSYWRIFETSFEEHFEEGWTESLNYKIVYNNNHILSIFFTWDGSGAYPDSLRKNLVINSKSGKQIKIEDVFEKSKNLTLLKKIRKSIRKRENKQVKENSCFAETIDMSRGDKITKEFNPTPEEIQYKNLNGFLIKDRGVTFFFDYNFAHVVAACEPNEEYFFSWTELKPFIRRDGLLTRFIR